MTQKMIRALTLNKGMPVKFILIQSHYHENFIFYLLPAQFDV
jgi:hypothetical protein